MKCLHILPMNKLSGAEKMALLICKNLRDYEPIVVCGGEVLKKVFEDEGIKSYSLNFNNKKLVNNILALKKIIKSEKIKIVHAHDNIASINAYLTKKIYKLDIKVISHIHNCYPFLKTEGLNKKIDSFLRPRYDFNIACGKVVFDFYKENTNYFREDKTEILSNAMDIEEILKFDNTISDSVIKEFNIPKHKTILGFIGRLDEQKGIVPFINEVIKNKEKFNDSRILLVGSGSQEDEVKKLIKDNNLEKLFILTGFQDNVYKFYPIIDIFFLPSLYEGLPIVLLEAMAFKKTIISMDVGSINEIIINNKTGILIGKNNYKEFISQLISTKNDLDLSIKIGNNAFDYIYENYNIKSYIEALQRIYKNIV